MTKIKSDFHGRPVPNTHPERMAHATPEIADEWAPILPTQQATAHAERSDRSVLVARSAGIVIRVQPAAALSITELGEITRLNDAAVSKHPAFLNRFDPETAIQGDTLFATAWRGGTLLASVQATSEVGKTVKHRTLKIGYLVSDGSVRGIAHPLIAALIRGDAHCKSVPANGEAVARVLPDGMANIGSTKTLMRLGFYAAKVITYPLTLRNPQKGCGQLAEPNGAPLRYLLLRGDSVEIRERANAVLKAWTTRN